jgi:hypothetical protein
MVAAVAVAWSANAAPTSFGVFPNNSTHSNASVAAAIANVPTNAGVVYDAIGQTNSIQVYNFNVLSYTGPLDISLTLERIRQGDWMPTESDDGGFFNLNNAGELPNIPRKGNNYYMEFVVWFSMNLTNSPNTYDPSVEPFGTVAFPGPMRLLIGLGGEVYFTGDHYGEDGVQTNAYFVNPVPSPSTFRITSIVAQTNGVSLTWPTVGGRTERGASDDGDIGQLLEQLPRPQPDHCRGRRRPHERHLSRRWRRNQLPVPLLPRPACPVGARAVVAVKHRGFR